MAKKKTQLVNRFVIVLDSSGSMDVIRDATIKAFNSQVRAIRDGAKAAGQKSTVSLITFGEDSNTDVKEKFFNQEPESLKELDRSSYRPSCGTPLLDAVGYAIGRLQTLKDSPEISNVVIVVTDGAENSSQRWNGNNLAASMAVVNKTDRWSFVFLVPPGARHTLTRFNIPDGNIQEWEATKEGVHRTLDVQTSQSIGNFYTARASGLTSSKTFFVQTDLSKVDPTEAKKQLTDIRDQVKVYEVEREVAIKPFIESKGLFFMKGRGFYQLTKKELIQKDKEVILMEKGSKAVYAGQEARRLLGLPDYQDAKVEPGNHMLWEIFVQSSSDNRKLVRGTKLIYMK